MNTNESFVIVTDSAADLPEQMLAKMGITAIPLHVFMKDNPAVPCTLTGVPFYEALSGGQVACTSAANLSVIRAALTEHLDAGKDILYLGFSSALSSMFATVKIAAEELAEEYPDRRIVLVDTLCASMGEGMLVYTCAEQRARGCTLDEVAAYAEENRQHIIHWFTVDDLLFLKRGGRLSAVTAYTGTLLGIKPLLIINPEGKIVSTGKARGRKNAVLELAKHYTAECTNHDMPVFLSHANAPELAETLKAELTKLGAKNIVIGEISAAIGAHAGPGTVALFYFGEARA